jgi:glycosyltransferase involved in cell wall biosynthesis
MGLSRARNRVMDRANGEVIAFIDDDCEADPNWLAVMAGYLQSDPSIGLVGGATVPPPDTRSGLRLRLSTCPAILPAEGLYDPAASRVPPPGWDWGGANVAVRGEVAARVGGFDEFLGPGTPFLAGEDRDYKFRLEALGVCMMATPRAVVRHTYGRRYGVRPVTRLSRAYARGGGAVAGKLTVSGDPRGEEWLAAARREFWRDILKPGRSLAAMYRLPHFLRAYREVVAGYTVDARTGCLQPRILSDQPFALTRSARRGGT